MYGTDSFKVKSVTEILIQLDVLCCLWSFSTIFVSLSYLFTGNWI